MKYLRIYNGFCQYIKFSCSVRNTREMYAVPSSIYFVYIRFVFCICSLIQIMGKPNIKLSRQKRSSYIKNRRSHTVRLTPAKWLKTVIPSTPSQTLHSCLASIPPRNSCEKCPHLFSTNSKNHTTQTTSDIFPIQNVPIQPVYSQNPELNHQNRLHHIHPKSAEEH